MRKWYLRLMCLAILPVCTTKVVAQAPAWEVQAQDFHYNMTVVAQIYLDFEAVNSGGNILGAFVGEELRGVAYPTSVDGNDFYFLTIYSNMQFGDSVHFNVYLESKDSIFNALEVLVFYKDACVGSVPAPYHINISLLGDFPIQLLPVPPDTTLDGIPFDSLVLSDYLITYDHDPITWSIVPGPNLTAVISSDKLLVDAVNPGWTGTDSVLIIATETGTLQGYADSSVAWYTILPNYIGPVFTFIPAQYALDSLFPDKDINYFLLYEGDCLQYEAGLIRFEDTLADPQWVAPLPGAGTMNLVLQLTFNNLDFSDPGILAGFVNGQLAGVATEVHAGDEIYYFLTLANVASGSIEFQFYDNTYQYLYAISSGLEFIPGGSIGTASNPLQQELAPLIISINAQGVWSATIVDSSFTGSMIVEFRTHDCDYPSKRDSIRVPFVWSQCANPSWVICPGDGLCVSADTELVSLIWFRNGQPLFDRPVLSIFQPGVYHYQGVAMSGSGILSCPLSVEEDQGCTGVFPLIHYPTLDPSVLTFENGLNLSEASVEINDFDLHWNGNGGNSFWHDPDNWEFGVVPNLCQHVIVPVGTQVVVVPGTAAQIWRLTVKSGAMLTVNDSSELKIVGN